MTTDVLLSMIADKKYKKISPKCIFLPLTLSFQGHFNGYLFIFDSLATTLNLNILPERLCRQCIALPGMEPLIFRIISPAFTYEVILLSGAATHFKCETVH